MLFGVAETKENAGTSQRKAWKGQAYTTEPQRTLNATLKSLELIL